MQRFLRKGNNILIPFKRTSRGGGGLPHHDPPQFKWGLHDHILWFKDSYEQQYYLTMKHNQYKGVYGIMWNIGRYYILGLMVPCLFYIYLKDYAHDSQNYYNANLIVSPTNPIYKSRANWNYMQDNIRESLMEAKHKDFLGRRGAEHYHTLYPTIVEPLQTSPYDKTMQIVYKKCPGGRAG